MSDETNMTNDTNSFGAFGGQGADVIAYPNREVELGSTKIWRALPIRGRRMVGPWCFLDRFGPHTFTDGKPMEVAPHPHMGLQTVTWLVEGEVLHNDSLGFEALLGAGGVNVMTSGSGIAHAEQTPAENSGRLNGAQLWVALPDRDRNVAPDLQHLDSVPRWESRGGLAQVFAGSVEYARSTAVHYSDIIGADIEVYADAPLTLPLDRAFEHAVLLLSGDCTLDGQSLEPHLLYYLETGRHEMELRSRERARILLIGGPPFEEKIVMWWNFVARTRDEIAQARAEWEAGERFGEVTAYRGARLPAPELASAAPPNPAS